MEHVTFPYYSNRFGEELSYRVNKGLLVVFDFLNISQDNDYSELIKYFKESNFRTEIYKVLCGNKFISHCHELASSNSVKDNDCIVVLVLSLGSECSIICSDIVINLSDIIDIFNRRDSKIPIQIPKVFFIQTCSGDECDNINFNLQMTCRSADVVKTLPSDANVLIAHSTTGYIQNSWYIKCLLAVFKEYSKQEDLLTMLTRVNRAMYDIYTYSNEEKMQISSQISQLTYKVFINHHTQKDSQLKRY